MALNDDATIVIDAGNFFTAPYNSSSPEALPADLLAPGGNWVKVGHTSVDSPFNLAREGGDESTLATLQNRTLRTKRTSLVRSLNFTLEQFDADSLKLYFGSNASTGGDGEIQAPDAPTPTTCSFLAVFTDGDTTFALYAPKAEIYDADDIAPSDTESLAGLPLKVKFLAHGENNWSLAITPIGDDGS